MATDDKAWKPKPELIQPLMEMGISFNAAKRGIYFTGSSSVDAAASWVFDHTSDPDLEAPFEVELPSGASDAPHEDSVKAIVKMVFVVNSDLKMGVGKIAAQVGHACLALHKILMKDESKFGKLVEEWETMGTPKIVVKGKDTPELMDIEAQAKHAGIPNYLVCDAGRTQVVPASVTVLGVFGHFSQIDKLTGHLSLL